MYLAMTNLAKLILSDTYTHEQLNARLATMRTIFDMQFYTKEQPKKMLATNTVWARKILGLAPDRQTAYAAIDEVASIAAQAPVAVLYIAQRLPDVSYTTIGTWLRKTVNPAIFMRIRVDPSRTAGCALVWNGHYYDFSIGNQLNETRSYIRELLQKYRK